MQKVSVVTADANDVFANIRKNVKWESLGYDVNELDTIFSEIGKMFYGGIFNDKNKNCKDGIFFDRDVSYVPIPTFASFLNMIFEDTIVHEKVHRCVYHNFVEKGVTHITLTEYVN